MDGLHLPKNYFDTIVKVKNAELTDEEKIKFHVKAHCNPFHKQYSHCCLCEFPLNAKQITRFDVPTRECSRLDFVIRKEYQFLKNVLSKDEIKNSSHLSSLENYYETMTYLLKAYEHFIRQADDPVHLDESKLNNEYKSFIVDFMSDCLTVDHLHKQIQEIKILRNKNATPTQRAFSLMYSCYIDFPGDFHTEKIFVSPSFFRDISNCFFDSHRVIHHSHIT